MQTQLYFWKPVVERHKTELSTVADYYAKTKVYFNDIDGEAKKYRSKLYSEYRGNEDTDYSAVSEWAEEESVELYQALLTMKSNHLLMTISLLYHTWEQQLIKFTIRELAHYFEFKERVMQFNEVKKIFKLHKVSIDETDSWKMIRELKLLTNTIKHGDGESAKKLRKIRPEIFESSFGGYSSDLLELNGAVLLDGYTLKVTENDLIEYIIATKGFWDEMPERAFSDTDSIIKEFES